MRSKDNDESSTASQKGVYLDRSAKRRIALGILIFLSILLVFAALQPIFFPLSNNQKYSELGLLGPDLKIGGYPTNVFVNQQFTLYGYLVNQEGAAQYYNILVKLGNQSTQISNTTYATAPVISQYYASLNNNQSTIVPMTLSITQTGTNERLIFELWTYHVSGSGGSFVYSGVWDRISLNVTAS
jgi:uncharacterized membrane protein